MRRNGWWVRGLVGLTGTVALISGAGPPASQAAALKSCAAAGSRVLAASGLTRVYSAENRVFACRPRQRRLLLGFARNAQDPRTDLDTVLRPRAAGRYVAFERAYVDELDHRYTVIVRDAATGRTLTSAPTGQLVNPDGPDSGIGPTTALALRRDGAVAWIVRDETAADTQHEVWVGQGRARTRLARAPDIAPQSLRLSKQRVCWTQGGAPRFSSLPSR